MELATASTSEPPRPRQGWSLEVRLRRNLVLILVGAWLLGSAIALWGVWHETSEVLDSSLQETGERLLALPIGVAPDAPALNPSEEAAGVEERVAYQIFDGLGRLRVRSHMAPARPLDPGAPDGVRDVGHWRVVTVTRADHARKVQIGETIAHRFEVIWNSVGWLVGALIVVLPLASAASAVVLRQALRTLEPGRLLLEAHAADGPLPVPAHGIPRELEPWLDSVNELIDQVRQRIESEQVFAAQTTHELRTPLAAARAKAQRLVGITSDPRARRHAQALVRQLDRLTRLSSRLLELARVRSGVALVREAFDPALVARMVVDEFSGMATEGRLALEVVERPRTVVGDVDAIGIVVRNLIDNALKHGGEQVHVAVRVTTHTIEVVDDGPGVEPGTLANLLKPFERGATDAEGYGLGLALIQGIVHQSGMRLRLISPVEDGRGFAAILDLRTATELFLSGESVPAA